MTKSGVLEAEYDYDFLCNICVNQADCYVNRHNHSTFVHDAVRRVDLRNYVKFTEGFVAEINM